MSINALRSYKTPEPPSLLNHDISSMTISSNKPINWSEHTPDLGRDRLHVDKVDDTFFTHITKTSCTTIFQNHLTTLFICNIPLTSVPEAIGDLRSLQDLIVNKTALRTLPNSIGNLKRLEFVNISNNSQLTTLPDSFKGLTLLKILFLNNNSLMTLPNSIGDLNRLEFLNLSSNPLLSLPNTLENLISLRILDLSDTELTTMPECLATSPNLERVDILDSKIDTISTPVARRINSKDPKLKKFQLLFTQKQRKPIQGPNPCSRLCEKIISIFRRGKTKQS